MEESRRLPGDVWGFFVAPEPSVQPIDFVYFVIELLAERFIRLAEVVVLGSEPLVFGCQLCDFL
jgi:hypothetical protein